MKRYGCSFAWFQTPVVHLEVLHTDEFFMALMRFNGLRRRPADVFSGKVFIFGAARELGAIFISDSKN